MRKIKYRTWWWRTGDPRAPLIYCDFQNQSMSAPCGRKLLRTYGEPWCVAHGTARHVFMKEVED